jgi:crossover junction endodeoxyribonuclease RusA
VLPFEFLVPGPAVSQQTRRQAHRRAWIERVRRNAARRWESEATETEPVALTLTYLHGEGAGDLDNLAKPVLDALKGLVFLDDYQVTDLVLRKRNLSAILRIENPSPLLSSGFDLGSPFLHVLVDIAPDQELVP